MGTPKVPKVYDVVNLRTARDENGEWFAIRITSRNKIHFWHITNVLTRYYSFMAVKGKYHRNTEWNPDMFRKLLADLVSPKPSVAVTRFAVNGQVLFSEYENGYKMPLPFTPEPLNEEEAAAWWEEENRRLSEIARLAGPAPFIVYAKHGKGGRKEYSWKLFRDNEELSAVTPGCWVLVNTSIRKAKVKVIRVEEAGDQAQPTERVLKNLTWRSEIKKKTNEIAETTEAPGE